MKSPEILLPYQRRGIQFVVDNPNCALHVDMGLGKTVVTLSAITELMNQFEVSKVLVVGPLRVARKVWSDEVLEWSHLGHLRVSHIIGDEKQRLAGLNRDDADIYCINRENLSWLFDLFFDDTKCPPKQIRKSKFQLIVADESQSYKSQKSNRWRALRFLRKLSPRLVELTGTPIPNGYPDLWAQYQLLDQGKRLGATEQAFKSRWVLPRSSDYNPHERTVMRPFAAEQIQKAIKDITLTLRAEDYLDLPPVKNNFIRCELSPAEMAMYQRMKKNYSMELKGKHITAVNAGALYGKLLQLANGAAYTDKKGSFEAFHSHKLDALADTMDGVIGHTLVFYSFVFDLERIVSMLPKILGKTRTWRILKTKQDEIDWNNGKIDFLFLHPAGAGHGLNLHVNRMAETLIWYGFGPNLEWYEQANARLFGGHRRIGKAGVIHHIVSDGTEDVKTIALLSQKGHTQQDMKDRMCEVIKEA